MLTRLYPALLFAAVLFAAFQWGNISQLTKDLDTEKKKLAACATELTHAHEAIDKQNIEISLMASSAAEQEQEASARSSSVMATLPTTIQQDKASPATANDLNVWIRGVF